MFDLCRRLFLSKPWLIWYWLKLLSQISLQFFKKHSDIFSFGDICEWISLKNGGEKNSDNSGSLQVQAQEHSSPGNGYTQRNRQTGGAAGEEKRPILER